MDDLDPITRLPAPGERAEARERLRKAISRADRHRRRASFAARSVAAGLALLIAWSVAPGTTEGDRLPLLGLADAIERTSAAAGPGGPVWYSRTERVELEQVPTELLEGAGVDTLRFLMPSVEETWIEPGDVLYRRITYGEPRFLTPGDRHAFMAADLGAHYPVGRTVTRTGTEPGAVGPFESVARNGKEALFAALERQAAGLGDRRTEEVEMLRIAADLMRRLGHDPAIRGTLLRAMADIPGIDVAVHEDSVEVAVDYLDGDRPLRLAYEFDADTAHLVGESLAVLATQSEPATVLSSVRYDEGRFVSGFAES